MKDWDLRTPQIRRALHDTGTVTAAAGVLRMTPSAVSQQLAALSQQVGTPLIEARGWRHRRAEHSGNGDRR